MRSVAITYMRRWQRGRYTLACINYFKLFGISKMYPPLPILGRQWKLVDSNLAVLFQRISAACLLVFMHTSFIIYSSFQSDSNNLSDDISNIYLNRARSAQVHARGVNDCTSPTTRVTHLDTFRPLGGPPINTKLTMLIAPQIFV